MSAFSANLNVMMKVVRSAARGLTRDFGELENLQVRASSAQKFAERAATRAENEIHDALAEARPNYGLLSPRREETKGEDPTRRWIFTALSGAANYTHGLPHWALSIALERKGEIESATIFEPIRGELFMSEKGMGAWANDRRVRVSDRGELGDAMIALGTAGAPPRLTGLRCFGAPALDLAYLAAGRYDGYWAKQLALWDAAAGTLILREAGGLFGSVETGANAPVIAANAELYDRLAKHIQSG